MTAEVNLTKSPFPINETHMTTNKIEVIKDKISLYNSSIIFAITLILIHSPKFGSPTVTRKLVWFEETQT